MDAELPPYEVLAGMVDHALLAPTLTPGDVEAGTLMARDYGAATVCVMPCALRRVAELLDGAARPGRGP